MNILDINPTSPALAGHMVTFTGKVVNLFDLKPEEIDLFDIGHGLAFNCRWNGHTRRWYSIAEHCLRTAEKAPDRIKALCLFHDAEEAYWGDIIRPLKMILAQQSPGVLDAMKETRRLIFQKFDIADSREYKAFDNAELLWEFENLVRNDYHTPMAPEKARTEWLAMATWLLSKPRNF